MGLFDSDPFFFAHICVQHISMCCRQITKINSFFSHTSFFIWFSNIGDSSLLANRHFRPICQVAKVPFKRRNAKIILCWIFCSCTCITFPCGRTAPSSPNLVIFSHKKSMKHLESLVPSQKKLVFVRRKVISILW
jgi:hypothetical protein